LDAARRIALASVVAAVLLAGSQIVVGWLARSTAVLAAGLESAGDALTSTLVVFGLAAAAKPSDSDHPYGHGRLETVTGLVVGLILLAAIKFRLGRRIGSAALVADAWNDSVPILSGFAALAALGLTLYDPGRFLAADYYGGFAVGLIVIFTGLNVAREASLQLMDTMPPDQLLREIRRVACAASPAPTPWRNAMRAKRACNTIWTYIWKLIPT
jgi:divalent metal cation (Fe/Co/Zn/Cd) transporter